MNGRLALSLAVSSLILVVGGFFAVLQRLDRLEEARARRSPPAEAQATPPAEAGKDAGLPKDAAKTLSQLVDDVDRLDDDTYQHYMDLGKDIYDLRREVSQLKAMFKQVVQGLGRGPGGASLIGWGLLPAGAPIDEATAKAYREEAEKHGVRVEDGRVTVRGFLNVSPNVRMPIEYFITRFPQAGHETLIHLVGNKDLEDLGENPYEALHGLATALYKGMVAAGFRPGQPTHPDPGSDPKDPTWVLATGDVVYIGVAYRHAGQEHLALATDWVIDPEAKSVLPVDAFRFTGSARAEDPDTGEESLAAENMGLLVSVWPTPTALIEVALESSLRNDYTYNFERIPKPEGEGPLYMDIVLSRTPLEPKGDGARPIERPPPIGSAPR